ncbi:hypothetical protein, partial [Nocardioides sp. NPDC006273]|uniref:hypothetical protein n=1 Tax=Nocardioides sp. NPDC006273 TaxID=3155598 RepID=UPI0033AB7C49
PGLEDPAGPDDSERTGIEAELDVITEGFASVLEILGRVGKNGSYYNYKAIYIRVITEAFSFTHDRARWGRRSSRRNEGDIR